MMNKKFHSCRPHVRKYDRNLRSNCLVGFFHSSCKVFLWKYYETKIFFFYFWQFFVRYSYHHIALVRKSHQRNTAENLFDLNAPLVIENISGHRFHRVFLLLHTPCFCLTLTSYRKFYPGSAVWIALESAVIP